MKRRDSKEIKKPKRNSTRKSRSVLFVAAALVIIIAFLFIIVGPFSFVNMRNTKQDSEANTSLKVPEFRKDGSLIFISNNGDDTVSIDIEVVDNQAEITRGLMYRPFLPDMAGMLFIFPREEIRSFWMKNTYISLDIIFINANYEIVTIQANTQPLSTDPVPSNKPAKYVIEVNGGFAEKYGVKEGSRVEF